LNFASLHELNLMVVIENNELATATTRSARQPAGTGLLEPYLIPNDTIYMKRVYLDTFSGIYKAAYEMTVESKGVKVLWVDTFRMAEHVGPNYDLSSHDRLTEIEMEAANYWSLSELDNARRINAEKIANAFTLAELAPKPTKMWAELGAPIE
jgi:TPP-dependent pyruvate/acetoin dehydrogenase alpha subunit